MKHIYKFSVVMAIYNMEEYLEEAILSVINQDIGFEKNIQLILVNDGSLDKSELICKKYKKLHPENIIYIKKENGGVSSARNEGIKFVKGKYINFLDADDKLGYDVFRKVYSFFESKYNKVNVVSIPMEYFEGKRGSHILNYKYELGTRVIDLKKEYKMIQLSSSSAFFKGCLKEEIIFNTEMKYAEDAEVVNKILLKTNTLGVVSDCKYFYRFRKKASSATQMGRRKKEWYLSYVELFSLNLINYCITTNSIIPKFVQFTIMYDLQWRLNEIREIKKIIQQRENHEFILNLITVIDNTNIKIIAQQKNLKKYIKFSIFLIKLIKLGFLKRGIFYMLESL